MSEPFLGEVRIFSFNFAPRGWATCDGQLLPISQNQALYSLLGTTFGGDGRTTFALPDLRGRTGLHRGPDDSLGSRGGAETHTLALKEMPKHAHMATGNATEGGVESPVNSTWGVPKAGEAYGPKSAVDVKLHGASVDKTGTAAPHENRSPYLTVNICIAMQGIFPSRS